MYVCYDMYCQEASESSTMYDKWLCQNVKQRRNAMRLMKTSSYGRKLALVPEGKECETPDTSYWCRTAIGWVVCEWKATDQHRDFVSRPSVLQASYRAGLHLRHISHLVHVNHCSSFGDISTLQGKAQVSRRWMTKVWIVRMRKEVISNHFFPQIPVQDSHGAYVGK